MLTRIFKKPGPCGPPVVDRIEEIRLARWSSPGRFSLFLLVFAAVLCSAIGLVVSNVQMLDPLPGRAEIDDGGTLHIAPYQLSVDLPSEWLSPDGSPVKGNHLTPQALLSVKDGAGPWALEHAALLNAALLFEGCVAHLVAEQVELRIYLFADHPDTIVRALAGAADTPPAEMFEVARENETGANRRPVGGPFAVSLTTATYPPGIAVSWFSSDPDDRDESVLDVRQVDLGNKTAVFAFMYRSGDNRAPALVDKVMDSVQVPM